MAGQGPYNAVVFAGGGNRCVWASRFLASGGAGLRLGPLGAGRGERQGLHRLHPLSAAS